MPATIAKKSSRRSAASSEGTKGGSAGPGPATAGTPPVRAANLGEHAALWKAYLARRDKPGFDALAAAYKPYVEAVAARVSRRLPPSVDIDDLVSAGCFGLMDALASFDPSKGVRFQTFGLKRIAGAMNDSLRAQDIAPRLARRREALVRRARDDFRKAQGRSPTEEELLRLLHADDVQARAIVDGAEIPCMSSLAGPSDDHDAGWGGTGAGRATRLDHAAMVSAREGRNSPPPGAVFGRDVQKWLGRGLSRSERLIITLYYFESLNMRDIGQVLGICEGRVSQIHALLLERLRARLTREHDAPAIGRGR